MAREQCVNYLLTQSNIIAAVEGGSERLEAVAEFVSGGVAPFFGGRARTLRFQANITFLR